MKLSIQVEQDEFTAKVAQAFDLDFDGVIETEIPDFKFPPSNSYNIGLIVGASGSGKTTLISFKNIFSLEECFLPRRFLNQPLLSRVLSI